MDTYIVQGGRPLAGTVALSGAKNLASKLLLATLFTDQECILENVPEIGEIDIALSILELAGGNVEREGTTVRTQHVAVRHSDIRKAPKNRLSILAIGPLLYRTGNAIVPMPGGDPIGKRPVDFHITALRKFGARIVEHADHFAAEATELVGTTITLPYPSVGATETVLLCGAWAKGTTTIHNAAVEPEILELIRFLTALGVHIETPDERTFVVTGTQNFRGTKQRVIADRLEAVSYAAAALATRGNIEIIGAEPSHLQPYNDFVTSIGGEFKYVGDRVVVNASNELTATTLTTDVYPGFATDWQQPTAVVLVTANGESVIHETVMDNRFGYCADLLRMGASIRIDTNCPDGQACRFQGTSPHVARIIGPAALHGTTIQIPDIRAGMAQLIAALIATGTSTLTGLDHLDRGYGPQLQFKLKGLGAKIERKTVV